MRRELVRFRTFPNEFCSLYYRETISNNTKKQYLQMNCAIQNLPDDSRMISVVFLFLLVIEYPQHGVEITCSVDFTLAAYCSSFPSANKALACRVLGSQKSITDARAGGSVVCRS